MESNEEQELQENAEKASSAAMRPVAFTMSLLAVLVAVTTVLGHRTHTEAVLAQNQATDQWNEYQAKKIRESDTGQMMDLLSVVTLTDKDGAKKLAGHYKDHIDKWEKELPGDKEKAEALEAKVEQAELKANRFDLGEALLEIALVVCSITLLTKQRLYWFIGMAFGIGGILSAASVLLLQ